MSCGLMGHRTNLEPEPPGAWGWQEWRFPRRRKPSRAIAVDTHCVSTRYTARVKDAGIRVRVEKHLRSAFAAACQAENKQASDVLREFMEAYVARHHGGQGDLFSARLDERSRPVAGHRARRT